MRNHLSALAMSASVGAVCLLGGAPSASASAAPVMVTASTVTANASVLLQQTEEEARRRARLSLGTRTAQVLGEALNEINAEPAQYQAALNRLNGLLNRNDLSDFDRSTALEIRGAVYAGMENYSAALQDFVRVLEIDELPFDRLTQIRYNVAQLYFQEENYAQTIRFMRDYLNQEGNIEDSNAWFILAAAYASQDNFQAARRPAEQALQYDDKKEEKTYGLLNLIYAELNLNAERARLLEEMVERFPNNESYWSQLSGAYYQAGDNKNAFATLEAAYNAGLITDADKIVSLAQFYSDLDNPFRGGQLLQREMEAGTVERNLKNLTLLSQLWSMAREQDRAIEALQAAAQISPSGELYYRLGQSYMASEQYREGIDALESALQRGGLSERDRGDIYVLLGSAYFNIDSETRAGRLAARRQFQRALQYSNSRRTAQGWINYIDAIEDTIRRQNEVERLQRQEQREREYERCESLIDVAEIGGSVDAGDLADCRALVDRLDIDGNGSVSDDELNAYVTGEPLAEEEATEDEAEDTEDTGEAAEEGEE
ncbi:tetratricopeptide repeat protein [Parvularcula bermudensis]|nr:hypothetical protein [Parvularcula bermudensis]